MPSASRADGPRRYLTAFGEVHALALAGEFAAAAKRSAGFVPILPASGCDMNGRVRKEVRLGTLREYLDIGWSPDIDVGGQQLSGIVRLRMSTKAGASAYQVTWSRCRSSKPPLPADSMPWSLAAMSACVFHRVWRELCSSEMARPFVTRVR